MATAVVILFIGLFTTICTLLKPDFYWENRKAVALRKLVGDRIAAIFYLIIGILCIGFGIAILLELL
ncbi:hypothetical protein [Lutispora thermophila]|uniref:Immunity protein 17 n=1 Tax=Lutispora thermophila DSM 19022 TaxID=1122184 RepID=A0A1M6CA92_9FIRM|nr:hypothetical protein [Lutispora thermophila]SHI57945.1 hypothetical protein SAMN02745176_00678 [Lutispora thermophila DSM 19022]